MVDKFRKLYLSAEWHRKGGRKCFAPKQGEIIIIKTNTPEQNKTKICIMYYVYIDFIDMFRKVIYMRFSCVRLFIPWFM